MEPTTLRGAEPPARARSRVGYLLCLGLLAIGLSAPGLLGLPGFLRHAPPGYWLAVGLAVVAGTRPFVAPVSRTAAPAYPSICFAYAILLIWGVGPAVLAAVASAAMASLWPDRGPWHFAFGCGSEVVAIVGSAAAPHACGLAPLAPGSLALQSPEIGPPAPGPPLPGFPLAGPLSTGLERFGGHAALATLAGAATWFVITYALAVGAALANRPGGPVRAFTAVTRHTAWSTGALLLLAPVLAEAATTGPALLPFALVPLYGLARLARLSGQRDRSARQDPLTGLLNRETLLAEIADRLGEPAHLDRPDRPGTPDHAVRVRPLALLLLGLDGFRQINDSLGRSAGDRLLVEVAGRLGRTVAPGCLVARVGGDEFAVVAPGVAGAAEARCLADRVAAALFEPVRLLDLNLESDLNLEIGASTGVALYPEHGAEPDDLMRRAAVAMHEARDRGSGCAVYSPESDHASRDRFSLLADFRRALSAPGTGGIAFYYQPQVELVSGEVIGVEALLRWHHPERGLVDPEELVRMAEHSAVMRLLTSRVIDDVVEQLARWRSDGLRLRAAVNVSVGDLSRGEIVDRLVDRMRTHRVAADQIQLEITEGSLMADARQVLTTLRRLDRLGVALSLDDFGTGYSSMQHLRRLPLAEIKIDRSFVLGMAANPADEAIVRCVIDLADALGLRVVAEGVEDERTFRMLAASGCHAAQGWFYARPMPADELVSWLSRYRPPQQLLRALPPAGTR